MAKVGKPRAFKSVAELQKGINSYLSECEVNGDPVSISGLAAHLEVDRATIGRYAAGDYGDEYCAPLKKTVQIIESQHVKGLLTGKLNPTGCIFTLKNNHGWKDQQHIEQTGKSDVVHKLDPKTAKAIADGIRTAIKGS